MKQATEEQILRELAAGAIAADRVETAPLGTARYVDPGVYAAELERVFRPAWHMVGRAAELVEPGSFLTVDVAGDAVCVVRDSDGTLRAFHNVCRHRGAQILREPAGRVDALRCPYHGFTYGLDGALRAVPEPDSFGPGFDLASIALPAVRIAQWGGWVWISLEDEGPELALFLGEELTNELELWDFERLEVKSRRTLEVEMGWKVGVEAFLEPLHVMSIHTATAHPVIDFRVSAMAALGDHSRMATAFRATNAYEPDGPLGSAARDMGVEMFPRLNEAQRRANFSYLVWPSTILSLLPNHCTVFRMLPLGLGRTLFVSELMGAPGESEEFYTSLEDGYAQLLEEDLENLPWIQKGLGDSSLQELRLSHHERRIRHFHASLDRWLA